VNFQELRFKSISAARAILELAQSQNRGLNASEVVSYDAAMAEAESLKATLDRSNAQNDLDREASKRAEPFRSVGGTRTAERDGKLFGIELRGLVTGSGSGATLATPECGKQAWDLLAAQSVGLLSGFSVVQTESTSLSFPKITADIAAAWTAEAGTISPTDASISQVTATPRKLAGLSQVSNELLRDSEPSVIDLLGRSITRSLALKADLGFFEGSGVGAEITGLKGTSGIGAVSMGTNGAIPTNLDPFADAIGALATANATATAIVMHPRSWSTLTKVKEGSGSTKPVLQESAGSGSQGLRRSIYGVPVFLSSQLSVTETQGSSSVASSAYVYQADQILVVRRTEVEVVVDSSRLFNSDQSELRAIFRLDMVVPNAAAVVRIAGILA
jgi:HK97 family phage major capsid protein